MMRSFILIFLLAMTRPSFAIVGGTDARDSALAAHVVMITSTRGAACSAVVLAQDVLLTAAHCVAPPSDYAALVFGEDRAPVLIPLVRAVLYPEFQLSMYETKKPTPDLAVVKLSSPLPERFRPARLSSASGFLPKGAAVTIAGFGLAAEGDEKSAGQLRSVSLVAAGSTGKSQMRLRDPLGQAGACQLDSGGPAFRNGEVVGVIAWANGHGKRQQCGWMTGVVLTGFYAEWIRETAGLPHP